MPFVKGQSGNPDAQFKPGESGNPAGKPKGAKHLSTWVQEMMNDENFELFLEDRREGFKRFEGAPVKAIVTTAIRRAAGGDQRWATWLKDSGWGSKVDVTSNGETLGVSISAEQAEQLIRARAKRSDT